MNEIEKEIITTAKKLKSLIGDKPSRLRSLGELAKILFTCEDGDIIIPQIKDFKGRIYQYGHKNIEGSIIQYEHQNIKGTIYQGEHENIKGDIRQEKHENIKGDIRQNKHEKIDGKIYEHGHQNENKKETK